MRAREMTCHKDHEYLTANPLPLHCCLESLPSAGDDNRFSGLSKQTPPQQPCLLSFEWSFAHKQPGRYLRVKNLWVRPWVKNIVTLIAVTLSLSAFPKNETGPQRKLNSAHLHELKFWLLCVKLLAQIPPPPASKQLSPSMTILSITWYTHFTWWPLFKHTPSVSWSCRLIFPCIRDPISFHLGPSFYSVPGKGLCKWKSSNDWHLLNFRTFANSWAFFCF